LEEFVGDPGAFRRSEKSDGWGNVAGLTNATYNAFPLAIRYSQHVVELSKEQIEP
jgi:hypothetical protein